MSMKEFTVPIVLGNELLESASCVDSMKIGHLGCSIGTDVNIHLSLVIVLRVYKARVVGQQKWA